MTGWRIAGRCCAAAGWVLWVVVQVVAKDPFPPEISLSQYGLGGAGWLFSVWVVVLASSPLLLLRYRPVPGPAGWLLAIGFAGTVVMAIVRTDEGVQQMSTHAMVHMAGAVIGLVFLPLGMVLVLRYAAKTVARRGRCHTGNSGRRRRVGPGVCGRSRHRREWGRPGRGRCGRARWSSSRCCWSVLYAAVVSTIDPRSRRAGRSAPVQSAIR